MVPARLVEQIRHYAWRSLVLASFFAIASASVENACGQFLGTNFISGDASGATAAGGVGAAAVGSGSAANGDRSTAVGVGVFADGDRSTAVGQNATAQGDDTTALGQAALVTAGQSTAVGRAASATLGSATALGFEAAAGSTSATAIGASSDATGMQSTAIGSASMASGQFSTTLGFGTTASADNSTAVGHGTMATFANSTAIGSSAATTRVDQIALGTTNNTYTAAGIASAASAAAQSGPVQFVTSDANGNLATTDLNSLGFASTEQVEGTTEGVAMAMALSGVPSILPEDTTYSASMNWGTFDGENAVALGGTARLIDNVFLNGGGAIGTGGRNNGGGRAGVTFAW